MAREKLDKEINIIEIIKGWRYFYSALNTLIPDEKKRFDLKERTRYIHIDPDKHEEKSDTKISAIRDKLKKSKSIRRLNFSDGFFSSSMQSSKSLNESNASGQVERLTKKLERF